MKRLNKMRMVAGVFVAAVLAGAFVVTQPVAAHMRVAAPASSPQVVVDVHSDMFQVTGTVTTTTGVTGTADLTGTTTSTTTSGSVLLPATGTDLSSSVQQVTGTMTTTSTTGITDTTTSTTTAVITDTTSTGSVLLPATGADLGNNARQVTDRDIIPLLMLLAGVALVISVLLMSFAKRDYRRQNDDR